MKKENVILSPEFLNFDIFVPSDANSTFSEQFSKGQFNTFIAYHAKTGSEELKSFLQNILKAVNLDLNNDVFLLDATNETKLSFATLQSKAQFKNIIFFGTDPKTFGINLLLKPYVPIHFENSRFLLADPLEMIQSDVNVKKNLWNCLKEMYLKW